MIIGEIRRFLRDNNSVRVSRSLRDTAYKAMQVKERLTTQNNKEPSIEEIAKELELPKEDVVLALELSLSRYPSMSRYFPTATTLFSSWIR
mgnify:CR=1 FL=1